MTMIYTEDMRFLELYVYFGLIINLITTSMYNPGPSQRYLIDKCLQQLENTDDRLAFDYSLTAFDQQLYDIYAPDNYRNQLAMSELYQPSQNLSASKLEIPKQSSLTDSLIRNTMGCEQKLAKSYIRIVEQTQHKQSQEKKKRVEMAKKKFAESNSHRDFCANSKPFMNSVHFSIQRPVIDNQHDSYLKTQLIFLQQPKTGNSSNTPNTQQYFDKHTQLIAKKINQLGGMQDTIGRMQDSLSKNEVKNFKKKQILAQMKQSRKNMFSPSKTIGRSESGKLRDSWVNRSRQMRESFMSKLQIE